MKKSITLATPLILCLLLGFAKPEAAYAKVSSDVEKAEKKVEKAKEKVEKAQKAVDEEIERLKKEGEKNPKAHGPAPELAKLRDAVKKAKAELEKARKALEKAAEDAVKKAQKGVDREKARRPPDQQKLDDAEKALKEAKEKRKAIQDAETAQPGTVEQCAQGQYYFLVAVTGGVALGDPAAQTVDFPVLQAALFNPETAGQLFEALGGEYSLGEPSASKTGQAFMLSGHTQFMPGLRLGAGFGERLELRGSLQYYTSTWTGSFPVTVFPFEAAPPYTSNGVLSATAAGVVTELDLAFFLAKGAVRPYMRAGARGIIPVEFNSAASLAGVALPLDIEPLQPDFSPFGGAGLRIGCWEKGFVEAGISFGKMAGGDYGSALELGMGWRFGGGR